MRLLLSAGERGRAFVRRVTDGMTALAVTLLAVFTAGVVSTFPLTVLAAGSDMVGVMTASELGALLPLMPLAHYALAKPASRLVERRGAYSMLLFGLSLLFLGALACALGVLPPIVMLVEIAVGGTFVLAAAVKAAQARWARGGWRPVVGLYVLGLWLGWRIGVTAVIPSWSWLGLLLALHVAVVLALAVQTGYARLLLGQVAVSPVRPFWPTVGLWSGGVAALGFLAVDPGPGWAVAAVGFLMVYVLRGVRVGPRLLGVVLMAALGVLLTVTAIAALHGGTLLGELPKPVLLGLAWAGPLAAAWVAPWQLVAVNAVGR